jgi:hypothetical protein
MPFARIAVRTRREQLQLLQLDYSYYSHVESNAAVCAVRLHSSLETNTIQVRPYFQPEEDIWTLFGDHARNPHSSNDRPTASLAILAGSQFFHTPRA